MKNDVIITPTSKPTATAAKNTYEIEGLSLNSTSLADEGYYYCIIMINGVFDSHSEAVFLFFIGGKLFFTRKSFSNPLVYFILKKDFCC